MTMTSPTAKLSGGDTLELKEAVYLFNVEIERFTPPMKHGTHIEKLKTGLDSHLFFGKKQCQSRNELDPQGKLTDDEYWKLRRSNLCHLTNVGLASFLTGLISKGIRIVHDGTVANRIGICHQDIHWPKGTETIHLLGLSTDVSAEMHKWCVLDMESGDRIIVDLAATQFSVFKYDRGYPVVIEPATTSPSLYPVGAVPSYDIVDQVSRMVVFFCDDANRVALATLEAAFDLVTEDLYTKMEDEATDMLWKVSEEETMADHREAFQSTRATLFSPEDCHWCHHPKVKKRCCGTVKYCGVVCQKKDRRMHRRVCTRN